MPSCLGVYIEDNLIKYAKVSKNNDITKVESFGIKFYDNLEDTLKQIIDETYSFNTPIATNIDEGIYEQFEIFSMLSKNDVEGVIETEFENICYEKNLNKNLYERKYLLGNLNKTNEKVKVINIAVPKTAIEKRKNQLSKWKLTCITPIAITIPNLIKTDKNSVNLIVNIEKNTTIVKLANNGITEIKTIDFGAHDILQNIKRRENSYSKAYEICKNSTIYTEVDSNLQIEENEYLEEIMPTLFKIVSEVKKITDETLEKIDKIYITGTAAVVNNIDIYFQDFFKNATCEILKPDFIGKFSKINIKDYVEVNSAISLAIQGLEKKININFSKPSAIQIIKNLLNAQMKFGKNNIGKNNIGKNNIGKSNVEKSKNNILNVNNLEKTFGKLDKVLAISGISVALLFFTYAGTSYMLNKQITTKMAKVDETISNANSQIETISKNDAIIKNKTTEYTEIVKQIEDINNVNVENKRYRNTIPNLLNNIMAIIPKEVQLTSIKNTNSTHITITATSSKYEQIAYFKTKLITEEVLSNVISDSGVKSGGKFTVTIEGELP